MKVKDELLKLKQSDIYSLILFALYKLKEIPEYSSLSELAYIMDKESLLNLCNYFGGLTIKIPTLAELEDLVYALLIYQYVDVEHVSLQEACNRLDLETKRIRLIKRKYGELSNLLQEYTFTSRG